MSAVQEVVEVATKPAKKKGKGRRILLGILAALIGAGLVAQLAFTFSGSGEWENMGEIAGVKLATMKVPGQNLRKYEAVFRVRASLDRVVAFMQDNESDIDVGFYKAREVERVSPQDMVTTWRSDFPSPFKDRDFVVRHTFTQDKSTGSILYVLEALPDRLPLDSCCVRVPRMDISWLLTDLGNGEVEIRWLMDMEMGGVIPYFMINYLNPSVMVGFANSLQQYIDAEKYADAQFDWIEHPNPKT